MKKVAYLKSPNTDGILTKTGYLDEAILFAPHFAAREHELELVDWRDPKINWSQYEFVVPKNAWDYHSHYPEFMAWLARLNTTGTRLVNEAKLVAWNTDKKYLLEMQELGACVAPLTLIQTEIELATLADAFAASPKLLLKPAVSGGGKQTGVYLAHDLVRATEDARQILRDCAVVVQPFFKEIEQGEWSFIFFGGKFSHAITKVPKAGDFRAHRLFGAQNLTANPTAAQIAEARGFLDCLPSTPRYARVDGVYAAQKLHLIEMELIEPYLYLETAPREAPEHFVEALFA